MTTPGLLAERRGDVLTITLNRPDALNAITIEMIDGIDELLDTVEPQRIRVIVLTGAGRAFSAGLDVKALGTEPGASLPALERFAAILTRLVEVPVPVIAQVNGLAMGGGTELILAADFAIAADNAEVGDGHTNIGVIPGGGGATILPRRVPVTVAKYVIYTGGRLTAHEWLRHGLFAEVVPADELAAHAAEVADSIARKSPLALAIIKQLIADSSGDTDTATSLARELDANRRYSTSEDMAEGLAAFADKRAPRFVGR
jgi:enoyl-CoA hydratase/carnithine racemase